MSNRTGRYCLCTQATHARLPLSASILSREPVRHAKNSCALRGIAKCWLPPLSAAI